MRSGQASPPGAGWPRGPETTSHSEGSSRPPPTGCGRRGAQTTSTSRRRAFAAALASVWGAQIRSRLQIRRFQSAGRVYAPHRPEATDRVYAPHAAAGGMRTAHGMRSASAVRCTSTAASRHPARTAASRSRSRYGTSSPTARACSSTAWCLLSKSAVGARCYRLTRSGARASSGARRGSPSPRTPRCQQRRSRRAACRRRRAASHTGRRRC